MLGFARFSRPNNAVMRRVLVVEDDEGIAAGPQVHLRQLGWAADGPTA
jgi:hypothetical protein